MSPYPVPEQLRHLLAQAGGWTLEQVMEAFLRDQQARWRAGERIPAEAYLHGYPALRANVDRAVDLVYGEFLLREALGEKPTLAEYQQRFPQYAATLQIQVDLHQAMRPPTASTTPGASSFSRAVTLAAEAETDAAPTAAVWPTVAGYEVLGELGRGGMGVVYKARHLGLDRLVALKMLRAGDVADLDQLTRFRHEAAVVAQLQHPYLVQIYEVGEQDGRPYCALEYVDGGSLAEKLAGTPQPDRATAQLLEKLARAMHVAHKRNVVHRDLKPANVLLTKDGTPKISDFGLAKRLDVPLGQTQSGVVMGTAGYMAPEQATGHSKQVGPAADVYALGAILYEMLTGRPPFKAESMLETLRQVVYLDPVPPRSLQPRVPRDLETICLKCLEKEPQKRYASAEALADDLQRFLRGEPIKARPIGMWEKGSKWAKRRPAVAGLLLVILLITVAGFGLVTWQWHEAVQARRREKDQRHQAEEAGREEANQRRRYQRLLVSTLMDRGLDLCEQGDVGRGLLHLVHGLELVGHEATDLERVLRTNVADWQRSLYPLKNFLAHPDRVLAVAFSPDGKQFLTGCADGKAQLWSTATGERLGDPLVHEGDVTGVTFRADGKVLLTGSRDKTARLWHAATEERIITLKHPKSVLAVTFNPDGQTVATGCQDGRVRLWHTATGEPRPESLPHRGPVYAVAFSPDGQMLLTGSDDRFARLWRAAGGKLVAEVKHAGNVRAVAFRPDGQIFLTGTTARKVQQWETATRKLVGNPLDDFRGDVEALAFSPDGKQFLTGSLDGLVRLWNATTAKPIGHALAHQNRVTAVAFHPDGHTALTGSFDRSARLWETARGRPFDKSFPHNNRVRAVAFTPDGTQIITGSSNRQVQLWDVATGQKIGKAFEHSNVVSAVALSADGRRVLAGDWDNCAKCWDLAAAAQVGETLKHSDWVLAVAYSADGKILTGSRNQKAQLWDLATGQPLGAPLLHEGPVNAVAFSPDGTKVLTGSSLGAEGTGGAQLWDVATQTPLGRPLLPGVEVMAVAFSADGRTLLTGSSDGMAQVWEAATGRPVSLPLPHPSVVSAVAFGPDGKTVLTGCRDWKARLWDVGTGKILGRPLSHPAPVRAVAVSPNGKLLLTGSENGGARLWPLPASTTRKVEQLVLEVQVLTGLELDADGVVQVLDASTWHDRRQPLKESDDEVMR
jgi:WD40 repeat protein